MGIDFMKQEKHVSVKLAACKIIIKYSRKLNKESKDKALTLIISIIDDLEHMLKSKEFEESLLLPIEAITQISRMNEEIVEKIAPSTTPILLSLFKRYH